MKKIVFFVTALMMIFFFSGCQGKTDLKTGKYLLDGNSEKSAYVVLDEKGNFEFHRGLALSYLPMGAYEVENDKLLLKVNEEEEYLFVINGDVLIFQGEIEGILDSGSRFLLEETKK